MFRSLLSSHYGDEKRKLEERRTRSTHERGTKVRKKASKQAKAKKPLHSSGKSLLCDDDSMGHVVGISLLIR
jgi:hypothetical protein